MAKKQEISDLEVLKKYHLAITFLRQKLSDNKLALCLGAGFGIPLKMPTWEKLVKEISNNENVKGENIYKNDEMSLTSRIEVLYETFRSNYKITHQNIDTEFLEDIIREEWMKIVHKCLYSEYEKKKATDKNEPESSHSYLMEYFKIIKRSPVTINYNFDDVLERLFEKERGGKGEKNYETTFRPTMQFKRKDSVIYHPNGFIPIDNKSSIGHFVFSERSFQDQLIDTMSGRYSPLQYMFLNYTMLITGCSLDDATLRHMLRKNASLNPGHFHFYICYTGDKRLSEKDKLAIQESYFETFNLVTLFLDGEGIKYLAQLLNMGNDAFAEKSAECKKHPYYIYYISGAPGTGKTTSLDYLADFVIQPEFPSRAKNELFQQDSNLTQAQRKALDKWLIEQFRIRNLHIFNKKNECCIQLIDRSPIDPLSYVNKINESALLNRAIELKEKYSEVGYEVLASGKVIVLDADETDIYYRLNKRNTNKYGQAFVRRIRKQFKELFPPERFTYLGAKGWGKKRMVKELAHEIFFGEYKETNLMEMIDAIIEKESKK